uniref:Peroxidase 20 n=1 Tax=Tanacetum cinerariifolium TaxID=118510 RepID=A0A6L2M7J1_TANCI|nr:peroxidase 20 [Tanacetum cinerariifolium]
MISGTDLHQFDVHNDGFFAHLPLNYVDAVILEMAVPRMPYKQLAEFLEEKCGCYFHGLYYQVPNQDLERGLVSVSDDRSTSYMFDVEKTFDRLTLYLDHLDMNLSEYLSQAITYNMDDLVSKKIGPPKKRGASGSGGASGSIGRGVGGFSGSSGSRGRGDGGSRGRGAGGSKRKPVSTAGTQKRQGKKKVRTSDFAKGFGLQDEPEQSQDKPEKTQAEPQQT